MKFDGPIPGANYLANTKNYPWHRPPDIDEYDEAVDYMINRMVEPEQSELVFALIDIETPIATIVTTLLLQAISKGKFAIDLAILVAGPLARYIEVTAKTQGMKYEMGINNKDRVIITPSALKLAFGIMEDDEGNDTAAEPPIPGPEPSPDGLMGMMAPPEGVAPQDEQAAMLGMDNSEEEALNGMA
jgi:hypothetical protein